MHRVWLIAWSSASALSICACATGDDEAAATNYGPGGSGAEGGSSEAEAPDAVHGEPEAGKDGGGWPIPEGGSCGPSTCQGCCLPTQACADGQLDHECGKGGWPCADCATSGTFCKSGLCEACTPACSGVVCGQSDGCGGTCQPGSGCCAPSCSGKPCGQGDGCGGTCQSGSGCCTPSCSGAQCGDGDGCGGTCSGTCPPWERCTSSLACECGPAPSFMRVGGVCTPSCGELLDQLNLPNNQGGCCATPCQPGTDGGGPGDSWDCTYCCASSVPGVSSCS